MQNVSLKLVIISSLAVLLIVALAGGVYVWSNSSLKETATTSTSTSKEDSDTVAKTTSSAATVAKTESTKTGTVTSDMVGADGVVDLSKVVAK